MTRQILTEFISPVSRPLSSEPDAEGKKLWLKGIFVQGLIENQNGRVYPLEEITRAVASLTKRIKETGPVCGELDHPSGLMISGQNVSHAIHEMWVDGNNGCGKLQVINAGMGLIAKAIIEAGVHLGVSSRGSGSVDSHGHVSDFDLVTIDIVTSPSAPNAFPRPVFESLINSRTGREVQKLSELQDDVAAQKYFQKTMHDYLIEIRDQVLKR